MFNIGGGEFLVIFLVALIVLGPTKLPEAARQLGKVVGEFRRLSSGFQRELKDALDDPVARATRDLGNDNPAGISSAQAVDAADGPAAVENPASPANEPSEGTPNESDEPPMYGDR